MKREIDPSRNPFLILSPYFNREKDEKKYDYVKDHRINKTKNYKKIIENRENLE